MNDRISNVSNYNNNNCFLNELTYNIYNIEFMEKTTYNIDFSLPFNYYINYIPKLILISYINDLNNNKYNCLNKDEFYLKIQDVNNKALLFTSYNKNYINSNQYIHYYTTPDNFFFYIHKLFAYLKFDIKILYLNCNSIYCLNLFYNYYTYKEITKINIAENKICSFLSKYAIISYLANLIIIHYNENKIDIYSFNEVIPNPFYKIGDECILNKTFGKLSLEYLYIFKLKIMYNFHYITRLDYDSKIINNEKYISYENIKNLKDNTLSFKILNIMEKV